MQEIREPFVAGLRNQLSDSMTNNIPAPQPMRKLVEHALQNYFDQLGDTQPTHLYELVLAEVEIPLLMMVLKKTKGNQTKAADMLDISRGTLRKKLEKYQLNSDSGF